jgi:hypothetical protein
MAKPEPDDMQLMRVEFPTPLKDGDLEWGGINLIAYLMDTQPQFETTKQDLRSSGRLDTALRGHTNKDVLFIELRDLKRLIEATEKPRNGWPIKPPRAALPFVEALELAKPATPEDLALPALPALPEFPEIPEEETK